MLDRDTSPKSRYSTIVPHELDHTRAVEGYGTAVLLQHLVPTFSDLAASYSSQGIGVPQLLRQAALFLLPGPLLVPLLLPLVDLVHQHLRQRQGHTNNIEEKDK